MPTAVFLVTGPQQVEVWAQRFAALPPWLLIPALLVVGLLYLLFGWATYRISLVATVVVGGGVGGALLAQHAGVPMLPVTLVAGIVCGLASRWVEKLGAFFLGGIAGALFLASVLTPAQLHGNVHTFYFLLVLAFLAAGSLVVLYLQPGVTLATAVLGALCIQRALLMALVVLRPDGEKVVGRHPVAVAVSFFILLLLGVLYQTRRPPASDEEETAADG